MKAAGASIQLVQTRRRTGLFLAAGGPPAPKQRLRLCNRRTRAGERRFNRLNVQQEAEEEEGTQPRTLAKGAKTCYV